LTHFPCSCQTWESEENGFQESEFLETNEALMEDFLGKKGKGWVDWH